MSTVTVAVLAGFVCCALLLRALTMRERRAWQADATTDRVAIPADRSWRAMMNE